MEPGGWATRFPIVLDHLLAGRLTPEQADAAVTELARLGTELEALAPDLAVASLSDLAKVSASLIPVNHAASSLATYFVAVDGRPLLDVLREAALRAKASGRSVNLETRSASGGLKEGLFAALLGAGVFGVALVYFPNLVLVTAGSGAKHGPPVWVLGVAICLAGTVRVVASQRPAFAGFLRRHGVASWVVSLAFFAWLVAATWK